MLHSLTLNNEIFKELSFDIERNIFASNIEKISPKILFISGLARSGTTALLNHLVQAQVGKSLTYNDLPFIFLPNLLRGFKQTKSFSDLSERAHGDQIKINEDSPEAIDEIFWKFQLKNAYIKEKTLEICDIKTGDINNYLTFIRLHLLASDRSIYVTKNNNSLLRISSFLQQNNFPAHYIFTLRDPLSHANSLLKQHLHFREIHKRDSFSLTYFNSLGHFEFGKNLKYFDFNQEKYNRQLNSLNPLEINYWLVSWLNYYSYLNQIRTEDFAFVSFSDLCESPDKIIEKLSNKFHFSCTSHKLDSFLSPTYQKHMDVSNELLFECNLLYEILKKTCI